MNRSLKRRDRITVLDAPSNLSLRPLAKGHIPGSRRMAEALRAADIIEALGAEDAGSVPAPPYSPHWQPGAGTRNEAAIARYSRILADRAMPLIGADRFVVVLGGDCSVLLGLMLGLRRTGRYGLLFVDGHLDFRHPGNSPHVSAAAGEDLALVTGRGDEALSNLEGSRPLVADGDVVAIGFREGPAQGEFLDILSTEIVLFDLEQVRRIGIKTVVSAAGAYLERRGVDGIWAHVDVDVIDSELMPAVDSPMPDGLTWDEFATLLGELREAPAVVGLDLAIFDPDLDADGKLAARLAKTVAEGLTSPAAEIHNHD